MIMVLGPGHIPHEVIGKIQRLGADTYFGRHNRPAGLSNIEGSHEPWEMAVRKFLMDHAVRDLPMQELAGVAGLGLNARRNAIGLTPHFLQKGRGSPFLASGPFSQGGTNYREPN